MGIHILNYLDDWLILAQSQADITSHNTLLFSHLDGLGLRVNFAKSILSPSQLVLFMGTVIDSVQISGASHNNSAPRGLLQGRYRPFAQSFPENARPYAAALLVFQHVLLYMQHIQFWLKQRVPPAAWPHGRNRLTVTRACVSALALWRDPLWLKQGVILDTAHRRKVVTTDASNKGWGALWEGKPNFGLWSEEDLGLQLNRLEMLAVRQACQFFLPDIRGHHVLIRLDSRSVVS